MDGGTGHPRGHHQPGTVRGGAGNSQSDRLPRQGTGGQSLYAESSQRQGVLTKDEYFDYKEKYESRIADLAVEMEQLEDGLRTMDTQIEQHRALEQDTAQIKTDRALTGALIERLIDRIEVSHDKQITVRYRFQSEFETYAEVLEQCRNM